MIRRLSIRSAVAAGVALATVLSAMALTPNTGNIAHAAPSYRFSFNSWSYPHSTFTQFMSINNSGRIVGFSGEHGSRGFTLGWPNSMQNENFPHATESQVMGINNIGDSVGMYVDSRGITHGFYRNPRVNRWWTMDVPGTSFNQLMSVNDHGTSAGFYQFGSNNITQPFTRTASGGYYLPPIGDSQMTGINNHGDVTGFQVMSGSSDRAFVLEGHTMHYFQFPGSSFTQAMGMNDNGMVVGMFNDRSGISHGFMYNMDNGSFHRVNFPGSSSTVINGINNRGSIVGFYSMPNRQTNAFYGRP